MTSLATQKAELRRAVLSRRAALPEAIRAASGPAIAAAVLSAAGMSAVEQSPAEQLPAGRSATGLTSALAGVGAVAAYVSVGTEPSTRELLAALTGRRVLLPVLLPDGELDWAVHDGDLQPAGRGLLEPAGTRLGADAIGEAALVVVPALAVDRRGTRLGRGGGSYDRALARATGRVVALLHDGELVDALPAEPHDVPVGAVVTPSTGLVRLAGRHP